MVGWAPSVPERGDDRRRGGRASRRRGRGRSLSVAGLLIFVVIGSGCSFDDLTTPIRSNDEAADDGSWIVLDLQNVRQRHAQSGASFYRALTGNPVFEIGVLRRRSTDVNPQIQHPHSAMYRVLTGTGALRTDSDSIPFAPGDVFFVREGVAHEIDRSASVIDILVVFRLGEASASDPEVVAFGSDEMVAERDGEANVFTELVNASTMRLGMYMIPKNGGDPFVLEHAFDEVKIVIEGGGRFDIGSGGLEAESGTMAYMTAGTRHQFRRTSDALDVIVIGAN